MTYHARGWIESRTTDGQTTSFYYDNVGNLTRVTQPDGSFSEYEYDDAHRLEAIADNFDNRIEYTLDAAGNRTAENTYNDLGVLRRQMSRVYDQLSRLQKIIDGNLDETLYGYDNNGNRTSSQDPNLNTTSFEYDPLDRLVKTIDATLGETLMGYDDRDNLTTVTDPLGNVTAYSYDGLDNQTQIDSPDTGITTYEYDTAGNRTAATDARGVRVEYSYDALNRLTFVDYPDNSLDVTFTYDVGTNGKGRLTSMDDAAGTETYTYDARGNLISVDRGFVILNYTTYYEYNGADRLTKITYPSGMVIDYTLDAAGRVTAVDKTYSGSTDNLVTNVVYEPFGPVSDFTFGNGLTMSASFDQDYELDDLQSGSSLDWVFGYDDVGNILTIDDQLAPANDQTFTYDDLYRLDTALGIYGTEDFDYDANGNRTRYQNGLVDDPYTYEPLSNRLATQDGWTFNRDAAGNRLDRLNGLGYGQLYAYGDHNRLAQVTDRDGAGDMVVGTYTYDGRGQRVARTAGGVTTHFIYGLNGELLGEYADDATPESEYVFLNGQPIAMLATEVTVPTPNEVIIDNDASDTSSTGSWVSRNSQEAVNGSHREGDGIETYRWTPALSAGTYEVYAWWVAKNNYSDSVDYTIAHDGGTSIENRSHKSGGGQWQLLGNYNFDGVGTEYVEVSAANGKTSADAIRWLEVVGGPVETISTFFIHTDHLGTPRRVTDDTQTVIWRWDSSPFGDSVPDEDPDGDSNDFVLNLRFPGQYYDAESGLHYNYYRDYDPSTGRYIESDPIGLLGGLNTFQFSLNHPLSLIDRFGLQTTYPNEFCITDSAGIIHCWPIPTPPVQPVPKQQSACDKIMADSCSKSSCKNCCTEFNDREDWRHMTFFRMLDDCADPSSAQPQGPGCMWPHVATDLINARANRAWLERCLRECGAH
jgi:RHS repeat-associated protein